MIIIGSRAACKWGISRRDPIDLDIFVREGSDTFCLDHCDEHTLPPEIYDALPVVDGYITKDGLYTLKCSHLGWDNKSCPHWVKTKLDILHYQSQGCELIPDLYERLRDYWKTIHGDKSFLSLEKSKEDFFTDGVDYVYDHDYLHELVAHPNKPTYTKCLKDGADIAIDKEKFFSLPFEEQLSMFREEITVIACERWLIPQNNRGKYSWYEAYLLSLRKTITNLTKGWAEAFVVQNLQHFKLPDYKYFRYILQQIEEIQMSKVDMSPFEEFKEKIGYTESMAMMIFEMCEDNISFGNDYDWENEYPKYSLRKENLEEYNRLTNLREEERKTKYQPYVDKCRDSVSYEHLEQEGGGEGGSEYCYGVFKMGGKIYRAEYSYYSYNGHEYDYIESTLKEVTPRQTIVTVYE